MTSRIDQRDQQGDQAAPWEGEGEDLAAMPGWNAPPEPLQDPADPRATSSEPDWSTDPSDLGAAAGGSDSGGPATATSSQGSTDSLIGLRERVLLGGEIVAALLQAGTGIVNQRLALHEEDPTWLADDQDHQHIAVPVGRVIGRNVPLPDAGEHTSDVADLIVAGIGLVGYLVKNLNRRVATRRALSPRVFVNPPAAEADPGAAAQEQAPTTTADALIANNVNATVSW